MPGYIDPLTDDRSRPALDALHAAGWAITGTSRHDPYLNGDAYTLITLEKDTRTLTLSLGEARTVHATPGWQPRGVGGAFVTWVRLPTYVAHVEEDFPLAARR
ncbi:hypothetical protein [Deinococcus sp. PEB2-63]